MRTSPHHTILLGPRYRELLADIFKRKVLAEDFSPVSAPSDGNRSVAGAGGCDAFYALSRCRTWTARPTGGRRPNGTGRRSRRTFGDLLPDLDKHVVTSKLMTPMDFRDRLCACAGAAFGLEPVLLQSAWFRPHNHSEDIAGLYLVGAGTHPGAGVPGVLSSAKVLDRVVPHAAAL